MTAIPNGIAKKGSAVASNSYELSGTVSKVLDLQTFSSGFTKREFVVRTSDEYPQQVKFECIKERCALLDEVREGDAVSVTFNIRGSEYKGKFFVNLQAWKLAKGPAAAAGGSTPEAEDEVEELDTDVAPF